MSDTNSEKWKTVKVPKGLSERIDEFVGSKDAYRLGLTSNSQVVAHAIRQFLENRVSTKSSEHEPIQ
tara:strand:- start:320 stop:520 length:201 start_codon:yes stop_codon:yes gene_type:complete